MELVREKETFTAYEGQTKCSHVVRPMDWVKGDYEIGVVANPGDGYRLAYDNYGMTGRKLDQLGGRGLSKLRNEYSVAVATQAARNSGLMRRGFKVSRENLSSGAVKLRLRRV
jgi:hypothetical protein